MTENKAINTLQRAGNELRRQKEMMQSNMGMQKENKFKQIIDFVFGTFLALGVFCYCLFASFMVLFNDDE